MENRELIVLAIETALHPGSVSILEGSKEIDFWVGNNEISRSEDLLPVIDSLLKKNRIHQKNIDLIAVSLGPGSFTGVRVGLATAKGLALGIERACLGVSTMEVLAVSAEKKGKIRSVVAGGRNEVFYQDFYFEELRKPSRLNNIELTELEKLFDGNSASDFAAIILDEKIKQRHTLFNNFPETKFQPSNPARYVGLIALENLKNNVSEELIPQYAQAAEIGKSTKNS